VKRWKPQNLSPIAMIIELFNTKNTEYIYYITITFCLVKSFDWGITCCQSKNLWQSIQFSCKICHSLQSCRDRINLRTSHHLSTLCNLYHALSRFWTGLSSKSICFLTMKNLWNWTIIGNLMVTCCKLVLVH